MKEKADEQLARLFAKCMTDREIEALFTYQRDPEECRGGQIRESLRSKMGTIPILNFSETEACELASQCSTVSDENAGSRLYSRRGLAACMCLRNYALAGVVDKYEYRIPVLLAELYRLGSTHLGPAIAFFQWLEQADREKGCYRLLECAIFLCKAWLLFEHGDRLVTLARSINDEDAWFSNLPMDECNTEWANVIELAAESIDRSRLALDELARQVSEARISRGTEGGSKRGRAELP